MRIVYLFSGERYKTWRYTDFGLSRLRDGLQTGNLRYEGESQSSHSGGLTIELSTGAANVSGGGRLYDSSGVVAVGEGKGVISSGIGSIYFASSNESTAANSVS